MDEESPSKLVARASYRSIGYSPEDGAPEAQTWSFDPKIVIDVMNL